MKQYKPFLLGILVTVLALSMFWVGVAFAATGCFTDTNGHPFENAICWMKSNGIQGGSTFKPNNAATRATVAQWLFKQSQIPPTQGAYTVTLGAANWVRNGSSANGTIAYFTDLLRLNASSSTMNVQVNPSLPNHLYGRIPQITGAQLCASGTASQFIDSATLRVYELGASPVVLVDKSDPVDRTSTGCVSLTLDSPMLLGNNRWVSFFITGKFLSSGNLDIYQMTFFLSPTGLKIMPEVDLPQDFLPGTVEGAAP